MKKMGLEPRGFIDFGSGGFQKFSFHGILGIPF